MPPEQCSYVFGNPPFGGFYYRDFARQRQMAAIVWLSGEGNRIDYVAAWFFKAGKYLHHSCAQVAFVATNSITQGEQVAQIWPALFNRFSLEISFAHRTFAWGSDARGRAYVHVVIVGLCRRDREPATKRLFSYDSYEGEPVESAHKALSPYLFDGSRLNDRHLVVERAQRPLNGFPVICVGTKPVDGGLYILDDNERQLLLGKEPSASKIIRPFVGGREHLNVSKRWIIYPEGQNDQNFGSCQLFWNASPRLSSTVNKKGADWRKS